MIVSYHFDDYMGLLEILFLLIPGFFQLLELLKELFFSF